MTRARDLADYISTGVSDTELDVLDGVTAGTVTASKALVVDANKDIASLRNITATGAITGDVTGNAATATALATARTIGGVSFDGTGNINLPGVNASGNQDTSGNAATATTAGTVTTAAQPNITSVGTLTGLDINGDLNAVDNIQLATALYHEGDTNTFLSFGSGGDSINLATGGSTRLTASNSGITINDITINGSTISDAGDLTLDVGGDIILDADGGDIFLKDAGTSFGFMSKSSDDLRIGSLVSDGNVLIRGNDGGSMITALTFDMSDGGSAVFNKHVYLSDNSKLIFGASSDLQIFHSTSDAASIIRDAGTGGLAIQSNLILLQNSGGTANLLKATEGGAVELLHGNSTKLETISAGVNINGNINAVDDIFLQSAIYHAGDTDTLVSFSADTVALRTGGSTRLTANNNAVYIETSSLAEDYDALSGTSPSCNVHSGGAFSLTMSGNTTFSFGSGSSGYSQGFILQLTGNGSTVTWPNTVRWAGEVLQMPLQTVRRTFLYFLLEMVVQTGMVH